MQNPEHSTCILFNECKNEFSIRVQQLMYVHCMLQYYTDIAVKYTERYKKQ